FETPPRKAGRAESRDFHGILSPVTDRAGRRPTGDFLFVLAAVAGVGAALAAYSNHFHNSFHFDDGHVIQNNAYIRHLKNIPGFFTGSSKFSSWPTLSDYRPVSSASFAIDYWRGGGLDLVTFHVTQWTMHVALAVLVFFFLKRLLNDSGGSSRGRW